MATTYAGNLGNGQTLYLANQGDQTVVTLSSTSHNQQQQQQSGFTTGEWIAPPTLFRTRVGVIARIESDRSSFFVQIHATGMQLLTHQPSLADAEIIPIRQASEERMPNTNFEAFTGMKPMTPMKPMKMGNMEMQMNPMQMKMGNMELRMGEPLNPTHQSNHQPDHQFATPRQFCTQCGNSVGPTDKFCAYCGHQLGH